MYTLPFGAVPIEIAYVDDDEIDPDDGIRQAIQQRIERLRASSEGNSIPYRVLTLSGGGARGAYGAGVLSGWTDAGTRPEFDVVTGISTGALMATHAFLGSDYNDALGIYVQVTNDDIFTRRNALAAVFNDALLDTTPFRETLRRYFT